MLNPELLKLAKILAVGNDACATEQNGWIRKDFLRDAALEAEKLPAIRDYVARMDDKFKGDAMKDLRAEYVVAKATSLVLKSLLNAAPPTPAAHPVTVYPTPAQPPKKAEKSSDELWSAAFRRTAERKD